MSAFSERFELLLASGPETFSELASHLDPAWLEESMQVIDTTKFRRRKLPGELVLLLVLGMALFRDRSIQAVVSHLGLHAEDGMSVVPSATVQARYRVGWKPLRRLFELSSRYWLARAPENRYAGMKVLAIDGSHMRVADTEENDIHFGRPSARNNSVGAYPQLRCAIVLDVDTRLVHDAHMVPWSESEAAACAPLWERLPEDALVILDRGFPAWHTVSRYFGEAKSRHALIRLRSNQNFECAEVLDDGSFLSHWNPPVTTIREARKNGWPEPESELVRIIEYTTLAGEPARLVTTLLDPTLHPAEDLVELYAERWEIETSFDELKFHLAPDKATLRSEKPDGVEQEFWGYLTMYNLIRYEMTVIAELHEVPPKRISFKNTFIMLQTVCIMAANSKTPEAAVAFLEAQRANVGLLVLPARRRRSYGRVVKIKMSNYKKKPVDPHKVARHHRKKAERDAARAAKSGAEAK